MDHTVENKHFPGVFEATPLRAPVRPWGHAPRQANPVLTQGRRGAQGRDTPPNTQGDRENAESWSLFFFKNLYSGGHIPVMSKIFHFTS